MYIDLLLIVFFMVGICLGLWVGWMLWHEPKLKYMENDDE